MNASNEFRNNAFRVDAAGRPKGGISSLTLAPKEYANIIGIGEHSLPAIFIRWQDGPLRDTPSSKPRSRNGAFVEDLIEIAAARLDFYQSSPFACAENQDALDALRRALAALQSRTARREAAGIEGTWDTDPSAEPGT